MGFVFVIVALRARHGSTHPYGGCRINAIDQVSGVIFVRDAPLLEKLIHVVRLKTLAIFSFQSRFRIRSPASGSIVNSLNGVLRLKESIHPWRQTLHVAAVNQYDSSEVSAKARRKPYTAIRLPVSGECRKPVQTLSS